MQTTIHRSEAQITALLGGRLTAVRKLNITEPETSLRTVHSDSCFSPCAPSNTASRFVTLATTGTSSLPS